MSNAIFKHAVKHNDGTSHEIYHILDDKKFQVIELDTTGLNIVSDQRFDTVEEAALAAFQLEVGQ